MLKLISIVKSFHDGESNLEVLKGVNSVLYGTRVPAGGLVNRITKKPQVKAQHSLKLMYGDYEFMRAELDTTSAIPGTDDKFAYRFIAATQDYPGYRGQRDQDELGHLVVEGVLRLLDDHAPVAEPLPLRRLACGFGGVHGYQMFAPRQSSRWFISMAGLSSFASPTITAGTPATENPGASRRRSGENDGSSRRRFDEHCR